LEQIKIAALIGLGLYMFATRIPDLIVSLGNLYLDLYFEGGFPSPLDFNLGAYVYSFGLAVQLVLSVLFMFVPKRIIGFLDRIRWAWDLSK
jgi:hypothetical protein